MLHAAECSFSYQLSASVRGWQEVVKVGGWEVVLKVYIFSIDYHLSSELLDVYTKCAHPALYVQHYFNSKIK